MSKHDFEEILESVKQIIVDNFNTKLTALTVEKGDSIVLPPVETNAYFMQSMNDRAANYDPIVVYGIENIETNNLGPVSAEKIFISAVILLTDNGRDNINEIMFRYSRAFKEIFEENWYISNSSSKIKVNRSTVVPFQTLDSTATYKAIGIEIEINL